MRESRLEAKVCKYLQQRGCFTHKVNAQLYPGFPDRIVIHKDFSFYLELKTPLGRLSKGQKLIHGIIKDRGILVFTISSMEQIEEIYDNLIRVKETK